MKKLISLILSVLAICSVLSGCSNTDKTASKNADSSIISAPVEGDMETDVLLPLIKENTNCILNIFQSNSLPYVGKPIRDSIYQVDPEQFADFKAFRDYLLTVYTTDYVDFLLTDYPYEGEPRYLEIDGKLCINLDLISPRGYFVNWQEPKFEILEQTETECKFKVTVSIEEAGDPPLISPYEKEATAVLEHDQWVLKEMVY